MASCWSWGARKCFILHLKLNGDLGVGWRQRHPSVLLRPPFSRSRRLRLWRREDRCRCCCTAIAASYKSKLGCVPRSLMMLCGPSCFSPFPGAHSGLIDKMCCVRVGVCTSFWAKVCTRVMLKHWVSLTFIDEDHKVPRYHQAVRVPADAGPLYEPRY